MTMKLSEIAGVVNGKWMGQDVAVESVSIDTRTLMPGQLYIAIKGKNFDGNDFLAQAEQAGAAAAMVHAGVSTSLSQVMVDDSHLALAELAGAWRRKLTSLKVVGVTGSNGKTTVKEMIAAVLGTSGPVLFTQGNLNNDIGVPLTLLKLGSAHRFAVIEMGANHPGEIAYTSRYAAADVVVITNAGPAHIEGFGSLEGVARAKGEIIETLSANGCAVINRDDRYYDYWRGIAGARSIKSFGLHDQADVRAVTSKTDIRMKPNAVVAFETTFDVKLGQTLERFTLNLAGQHNVVNALAAIAVGLALGLPVKNIKDGLAAVKPVTGRLQPLRGRLGNLIIDDTYNANSASLKAGLDVLTHCSGEPWLVLGAFGELGTDSPKMHEDMGGLIKSSGVVRLLATGSDAKNTVRSFGKGATFFDTQQELIKVLTHELSGTETILIKGSRVQRMENVAAALVENFRN